MASGIAPVWTTRKASMVTRRASEKTLRDLYADEFFIEEQHLVDDNLVEEQYALAVLPKYCIQVELVSTGKRGKRGKRHDSVMSNARPASVAKPIQDMQHVCRPYSAQATSLFFDADVPYDNDEELALHNDLYPEETEETPVPGPVQQIIEFSPTPELLDTSDLKLQPTLIGPLRDHVSEMLDLEIYEVQETASECVPKGEGRPLVCPIPLYTVAEDNEQGGLSMQELTFMPGDDAFSISDVECHSFLDQIPTRPFLPGLEHLTDIESRAAFISYDCDIEALAQSSVEFLDDYHHFESPCLGAEVSHMLLPGENFLLASNDPGRELSMPCLSAESLLSSIEKLSECEETLHADDGLVSAHLELPHVVDASRPGVIFDTGSFQFVGYTALDHAMGNFNIVSDSVSQQSEICDDVSDISDEEVDELPMSQPSQLTYYDADSRQFAGYTAFNQLLMDTDNDDSLSHVHREDEYLSSDFDIVDTVREMGALRVLNDTTPSQERVPRSWSHSTDVDISYDPNRSGIQTTGATKPRPIESLQSFVRRQSSRRCPNLTVQTRLSDISEDTPDNDLAPCTPSSPDMSDDFADCRSFVRPTSARRANFLDDEDSDDDMDRPQLPSPEVSMDFEALDDELEVSQAVIMSSVFDTEPTRSNVVSSPPSLSFSGASTDFTECGRPRQDSVADLESTHSASITSLPGLESSISAPMSLIAEHLITLFDNEIWHQDVDLFIAMPLTPVDPYMPSADQFPVADILNSLETELYGLIASLFACLSNDRFTEALTLGSDLQWAISAITGVYPRLDLMQRLGNTVEILLKRVVALGRH